ncbi:HNH endonuclease [Methanolacinia petrolearia DSM 11571]|uniref:HNH endonuclease n=1 Tax=Methanolacinia petrolearia (strain DSM 11571 / OCM 486 / SEBR 4847) TaxID=679926 RepID=E1RF51_METP4|nr:HNH endonuclease [Methanolacinia petrolearia]ADN37295.1 HNH endonuclease [Methanolacinia petrolearia DSM 11571]
MPPAAVKTIRDQIFWQYAKLISKSAGLGGSRGFQMKKFIQLRDGDIVWSSTIREWLKEHEKPDECIYCGAKGPLTTEHILPRSCGGPDIPDNAIRVCRSCNSGKGGKRLYEWMGLDGIDTVPRIAEGKYLKLLYELHEKRGTLDVDKKELGSRMCPGCNLRPLCDEEGTVEKLTVYCLEGIFHK